MSRRAVFSALCAGAAIAALACVLSADPARAQGGDGPGVVGSVINGSSGGAVPAGLPITISVRSEGGATQEITTTTSITGVFRLESLSLQTGDSIAGRTQYQGVTYTSEPVTVAAGSSDITMTIQVYETTDDASGIVIDQLHLFVTTTDNGLQVLEYYLVGNVGDRTYVGQTAPQTGQRVTLTSLLPEGAAIEHAESSGAVQPTVDRAGRVLDAEPVRPGLATVETFLTYQLPHADVVTIQRSYDVPVQSVVMFVPHGALALVGAGLEAGSVIQTEAGPMLTYTAAPLAVGETLSVQVLTATQPAAPTQGDMALPVRNTTHELAIGLAALAVAGAALYLMGRKPDHQAAPEAINPMLCEILALDRQFEAQEIEATAYQRQRQALVRQAVVVLEEHHDD